MGSARILLALRAIDKVKPVDHMRRGVALVELGDWYLSGGELPRGLQAYREAWKDFELGDPRQRWLHRDNLHTGRRYRLSPARKEITTTWTSILSKPALP